MAFPDRIERTIVLNHPPERVWAALTTAEGLGTWFGHRAEIDLRVGGEVKLAWDSSDTATTLTMVESGVAQVPDAEKHKSAFSGNTEGWTNELGELVAYLDGQA